MVEIVRIPRLGLSDYGELVSWEVDVGDTVAAGDVVAVLESDKASAEIESPADGVLLKTYVDAGTEIAIDVGTPLAVVGEEGESVPSVEEVDGEAEREAATGDGDETAMAESDSSSEGSLGASAGEDVKATPRARRAAREADVDLTALEGTGPQGAITEGDVEEYRESDLASGDESAGDDAMAAAGGGQVTVVESRELSATRKTIAERLSRSAREKPHVVGAREIRIDQLERVRDRLDDAHDVDVSLNDLILHFVGEVLRDLPEFNAHFEDGEHRLLEEVNVGYAVDGPRGLTVPVIGNVDERSVAELSERRQALVGRVLDDDHTAEDLQGGTFTVTNVGVFGMDFSYSIINPPEVAILSVGRRKQAPVETDGDIEFRTVITFTLSIDHRVLDGADSGDFLERLAESLEYPGSVLKNA